jgi:hypothetical protein
MADEQPIAWQRITEDTVLGRGPILFWGAVLTHSAVATAIIYDGVNAGGRRVMSLHLDGVVSYTLPALLPRPILLPNGLFIDVSTAPDDLIVFYESLPG